MNMPFNPTIGPSVSIVYEETGFLVLSPHISDF